MDVQQVLLSALIAIGAVHADTKTWNKDVNFHNVENWNRARIPCPSDSVFIPENSTSLFLQMDSTLKEVILPMQGEIVLGSDITLTFSDVVSAADPLCRGQDITFTRKGPESWLNPSNWDSDTLIPIASDRVPCEYDSVQFPPNKRFYVGIKETILAGTVSINDQVLSGSLQAASFLASPSGQSQFDLLEGALLKPSGLTCGDMTGCVCGNNREKVLNRICEYVGPCPEVSCENPVKPVGACCPRCGAFLTLNYDSSSFEFDELEGKLHSDYDMGSGGNGKTKRGMDETVVVYMYMSKTEPEMVQVVLTDNGRGTDQGRWASQLAEQIATDIERDPSAFGLLKSEVAVSAPVTGGNGGFGMGGAIVIILVVVGIILVISIIFVVLRRNRVHFAPQFLFRKDEPLDADIEMNQKYMEEVPPPEVAFDNPMYNKPIQDTIYDDPTKGSNGSDSSVEDLGSIGEADGGFSNPMAVTTH